MTTEADILGRPPIMRPLKREIPGSVLRREVSGDKQIVYVPYISSPGTQGKSRIAVSLPAFPPGVSA